MSSAAQNVELEKIRLLKTQRVKGAEVTRKVKTVNTLTIIAWKFFFKWTLNLIDR